MAALMAHRACTAERSSLYGTILVSLHTLPSKGMYSMNLGGGEGEGHCKG